MQTKRNPAAVGAVIYGSISAGAAAVFFTVTTLFGDYAWAARVGGSGWVLLLSLIVTVPTVTQLVRQRSGAGGTEGADAAQGGGHAH